MDRRIKEDQTVTDVNTQLVTDCFRDTRLKHRDNPHH